MKIRAHNAGNSIFLGILAIGMAVAGTAYAFGPLAGFAVYAAGVIGGAIFLNFVEWDYEN